MALVMNIRETKWIMILTLGRITENSAAVAAAAQEAENESSAN